MTSRGTGKHFLIETLKMLTDNEEYDGQAEVPVTFEKAFVYVWKVSKRCNWILKILFQVFTQSEYCWNIV